MTRLAIAVDQGHADIAELLREHGAKERWKLIEGFQISNGLSSDLGSHGSYSYEKKRNRPASVFETGYDD